MCVTTRSDSVSLDKLSCTELVTSPAIQKVGEPQVITNASTISKVTILQSYQTLSLTRRNVSLEFFKWKSTRIALFM